MKLLRRSATVALLLFVGATVGLLIAQEVSLSPGGPIDDAAALDGSAETNDAVSAVPVDDAARPVAENTATEADSERSDAASDPVEAPPDDIGSTCVVDAIYFHNTHRCWTCQKIERDAKAIIETEYADALADGTLRWSAIDMEVERQYVDRYALTKPTLILARQDGDAPGEWQALDETWALVRNEPRFALYVEDAVGSFLEGCR